MINTTITIIMYRTTYYVPYHPHPLTLKYILPTLTLLIFSPPPLPPYTHPPPHPINILSPPPYTHPSPSPY